MSTLFFRILAGISPFLVAFLEDKFNTSFLISLSVTFKNLMYYTLLWFLNVPNIFTSSSRWLILFALRCMCLAIFLKYPHSATMTVFERYKYIVKKLYIEETVRIIFAGGNYTDKFAQGPRKRKRSTNIYFKQQGGHQSQSTDFFVVENSRKVKDDKRNLPKQNFIEETVFYFFPYLKTPRSRKLLYLD